MALKTHAFACDVTVECEGVQGQTDSQKGMTRERELENVNEAQRLFTNMK